jgi:hypothetical protein
MRFCPWYPLAEGDQHAPPERGVFQVRVADGLLDYPTGKSAMVHYQLADDVRAAVARFAAEHPGTGWLCRHAIELAPRDVVELDAFCDRLLRDFRARFGAPPAVPR